MKMCGLHSKIKCMLFHYWKNNNNNNYEQERETAKKIGKIKNGTIYSDEEF